MAYGTKKSAFLSGLRAALGSRTRGAELRDRSRVRTVKISVGVGSSFQVNVSGSAAEIDSGIDIPTNSVVLDSFVEVLTAEVTGTTKTLNIGLLSSETGGNASGFLSGTSVAATGTKTTTIGALNAAGLKHPIALATSVSVTAGSNNFAELSANVYITYCELQGEV